MSEDDLEKSGEPEVDAVFDTAPEAEIPVKVSGEWQMPQPVFRQTSGYLPQGFEKKFGTLQPASVPTPPPADDPAPTQDPIAAAVEPQPFISEEFSSVASVPAEPAKPAGRSALRLALIILGLVAMLAFAVGFIVTVYFLFVASRPDTSF